MTLSYAFASGEIIGTRKNQEDFYLFNSSHTSGGMDQSNKADWVHIAIADGMGGHVGGEIASAQTAVGFMRNLRAEQKNTAKQNRKKLEESLDTANRRIASWVQTYPENRGMGCTLIGAILEKDQLSWISVGDSLLYLYRDGKLSQLNADHSYASILKQEVLKGRISEEDAKNHPQRNQLLTAIVGEKLSLIDSPAKPLKLKAKDRLLFATDGLLSLSEQEISKFMGSILRPDLLEEYCAKLLAMVDEKQNRNQDNTTVLCVYCYE